ncbi:MAG TPA: cation:proton antiporter [Alphaproteobacteria bacterium]|nr:cation:proton antiport protein [Rhodospirillaceae bacterium]HRJ12479.1 cation:proton antiporter [Alphaproteobacteria bacterium]
MIAFYPPILKVNRMEEYELIRTIALSIVGAFICGFIARKLKLPTILGYLVAGMLLGPHTPGFIADAHLAKQLAEIGIILLMFGVGLHFSLKDLINVRKIALPGALFQMLAATLIGAVVIRALGFPWINGFIFGLTLSVASTVVLLRALEHRHSIDTPAGKIAVGWLIVEDLAMVLAIVFMPVLADIILYEQEISSTFIFASLGSVLLKIGIFAVLMIFIGRRVLPGMLVLVAKTKSRELSSLAILAIALGLSYVAYSVFDASFALGAFLAGMILNESEIGHRSAEQSEPLRNTFAVLFFVSVGMLFNPRILLEQPVLVFATLLIIIVGKVAAALVITRIFRQTREASWTVAISLAQIGEFSFILAGMALMNGLMLEQHYNMVLAGAILSIGINPFLFKWMDKFIPRTEAVPAPANDKTLAA